MRNFTAMLADGYSAIRDLLDSGGPRSRLAYLSDFIFDFTTYDDEMSELFATKALEVCSALNERKTFAYIEDPDNYRWYLLMCNMPFFHERLGWGTSIRGAWWHNDIEFNSSGLWLDGEQIVDDIKFTADEWKAFIAAAIEFSKLGDEVDL